MGRDERLSPFGPENEGIACVWLCWHFFSRHDMCWFYFSTSESCCQRYPADRIASYDNKVGPVSWPIEHIAFGIASHRVLSSSACAINSQTLGPRSDTSDSTTCVGFEIAPDPRPISHHATPQKARNSNLLRGIRLIWVVSPRSWIASDQRRYDTNMEQRKMRHVLVRLQKGNEISAINRRILFHRRFVLIPP